MSRPELLATLRASTPAAPPPLRARVLELAAAAPPPHRRIRPRIVLVAVAFAALVASASAVIVLLPGGGPHRALAPPGALQAPTPGHLAAAGAAAAAPAFRSTTPPASAALTLPPPSTSRVQSYAASLRLRLATGAEVAAAARRAVTIAGALGGYPQAVRVSVSAPGGAATIVLRVPRLQVALAVTRLSALGTVLGEQVSVADLQSGIDTTSLRIVRLERQLAAAIHAAHSPREQRLVSALTAQIEGLQRSRAATVGAGRDATVALRLTTPAPGPVHRPRHLAGHGPFHELGVAFRAVGIGTVYVLALGTPLALLLVGVWLLVTRLARRRDDRLLSRS